MPTPPRTPPEPAVDAPADPGATPAASAAGGEIELTGRVERRVIAAGTKSEHPGEVLLGDDGSVWTLRRQGGPAFGDTVLASLAGQRLRARGRLRGNLLLLTSWKALR